MPSESGSNGASDEQALRQYREKLVELAQRSQTDFDRTVIALSGGALGVSFAFVKDFLGGRIPQCTGFLMAAWAAWITSLLLVLWSYYFSALSMRKAISQLDAGTIRSQRTGGWFAVAIAWLNALGGLSFLVGIGFAAGFVFANVR